MTTATANVVSKFQKPDLSKCADSEEYYKRLAIYYAKLYNTLIITLVEAGLIEYKLDEESPEGREPKIVWK